MRRLLWWLMLALTLVVIGAVLAEPAPIRAADCSRTTVNLTPLTELAPSRYQGLPAGLYPNGLNDPSQVQAAIAMARSAQVQPLDRSGAPAADGRIVYLSIGMTFASLEYQTFMELADGDPQLNPALVLVDGAQEDAFVEQVADPGSAYWATVGNRLGAARVSRDQVQVIWLKEAEDYPEGAFPEHAEALAEQLEAIVRIAHEQFPNLQLVYLSSRVYGAYAEAGRQNRNRINPEPYAYESAFSVRWLIERQWDGDPALNADPAAGPVTAPALLWGPYLWADGLTERDDGLTWACADFLYDGNTPSETGRLKVANQLLGFCKTHFTARSWCMREPNATPLPSATQGPTSTPTGRPTFVRPTRVRPTAGPSPTPGPTSTPRPMMSYRVREVPSNDEMWVTTDDPRVARGLASIDPSQPLWVCGLILVDDTAEWGFRFDQRRITLIADPPALLRSTIREIAANPPSGGTAQAARCIQVGQVSESIEVTRTPVPTWDPRTPTPTARGPVPGTRPTRTLQPTRGPSPTWDPRTPTPTQWRPGPRRSPTPTRTATPGRPGTVRIMLPLTVNL